MIRRPPRSTLSSSSAASDVYKRQQFNHAGDPPPVVAQPVNQQPKPCCGCCPAVCHSRKIQMRMTVWGGILSVVGFFMWVSFASAGIGGAAATGFLIMFISAIVSIVGCTLYCGSNHTEDYVGNGMVGMVQTPAAPSMIAIQQPQMVGVPGHGIPVGQVVMAQPVQQPPDVEAPPSYEGEQSIQKLP
eukprot:TRINITY_DN3450_c0_g1_i6.p1 TRINITY_DN3450_c0_g1~~TRINITY_DN3450_c0_g1_i6.p1  ORF type:complete len:187 (+),score=30.70 TRINITY_DN3450_c0_g1_i6:64-624(+)